MNWYIVSPNYRENSGGIVVLHRLCHYLNCIGEKATISAAITNPALFTPRGGAEEMSGICVIPEIYSDFKVDKVVRYVLNEPGKIGGPLTYPDDEYVITYNRSLLESAQKATKKKLNESNVLFIPVVDTTIFNDLNTERSITTFWVGKGKRPVEIGKDWVEITYAYPENKRKLAELLRSSKAFVSFDGFTSLIDEARLCGCPVVRFGDEKYDKTFYENTECGRGGIAFSWEEVEEVKDFIPSFRRMYELHKNCVLEKLANFVRNVRNNFGG